MEQVTKSEIQTEQPLEMSMEVEEVDYCKIHVKYQGDPAVVREKQKDAIKELRKIQIPGFRKGKAPDYAIKAKCKRQINNHVMQFMVGQAYDDVQFEQNIKPIGQPNITNTVLDGNKFSCELEVFHKPEIELKQYKEFEIPKPDVDQDPNTQVQQTLQALRERNGDVEPYGDEDFVEKGDQITLDVTGIIDGEEIPEFSIEAQLHTVGQGLLPGFDDAILGMAPGDEREFEVEYPKDQGEEKFRGKVIQFKVTVHMGMKKKPCPLDDSLAQKLGVDTLEQLKNELKKIAKANIDVQEKKLIGDQIKKRLVAEHDFQVPQWLLNMEAQYLAASQNVDWKQLGEEQRDEFLNQSVDNVKLSLLFDSIRDEEPDAVLSDQEALEAVKQQAKASGHDPENFLIESQNNGRLLGFISAMKDQFTLQFLIDNCTLVE